MTAAAPPPSPRADFPAPKGPGLSWFNDMDKAHLIRTLKERWGVRRGGPRVAEVAEEENLSSQESKGAYGSLLVANTNIDHKGSRDSERVAAMEGKNRASAGRARRRTFVGRF